MVITSVTAIGIYYVRHFSEHFVKVILYNFHNNPVKLVLSPFFWMVKPTHRKFQNFPRVTQTTCRYTEPELELISSKDMVYWPWNYVILSYRENIFNTFSISIVLWMQWLYVSIFTKHKYFLVNRDLCFYKFPACKVSNSYIHISFIRNIHFFYMIKI